MGKESKNPGLRTVSQEIPLEAREMMLQFQLQEERLRIERDSKKVKIVSERIEIRGTLSAKQMVRLARQNGLEVTKGNGRHGLHIVDSQTGESRPLPVHGGGRGLSNGVQGNLVDFIQSAKRRKGVA